MWLAQRLKLFDICAGIASDSDFSFTFSPPSPDALFAKSDAPEVPISSSPGDISSPILAGSVECAYSLQEDDTVAPTRPITPSDGKRRSIGESNFSAALDERLLLLAAQTQDDSDSGSSNDEEESTPQHTFRIVKRAHSGVSSRQGSLQFYKVRRVESNSVRSIRVTYSSAHLTSNRMRPQRSPQPQSPVDAGAQTCPL